MKKSTKFIGLALVVAAMMVPAVASASTSSVTRTVGRQFGTQIRNRAALTGIRIIRTTMKCKADGGNQYSCLGTYTAQTQGVTAKYGIYINVNSNGWRTVGKAFYLGS